MLNRFAFASSLAVLTAALYVLFGVLALASPRTFQLLFNAQLERTSGTACRQPDGTWRLVN